jgi:SAM-dependent methyltransferase
VTDYVRATEADNAERWRMALLYAHHGVLTIEALKATGVSNGWRWLDVGARGRWHHAVASGPCRRWRIVIVVDLETHWVDPLAGEVVGVRSGDFGRLDLDRSSFDLVVAQILLLHLPNPQEACRRFVEPTAPGGQIVIYDAEFTPLALANASSSESAGSRSCST